MVKHAYLIIAHEAEMLLRKLVASLDDERNDIYIHIDKKANYDGGNFSTKHAGLYILSKRIDAYWGDFSLVEIELSLFETASLKNTYAYYHLLSGVDLPIKSQNYIHDACNNYNGCEFIGFSQDVTNHELYWRTQHYFLFSKDYKSNNWMKKLIRKIFINIQDLCGYSRSTLEFKKGSQWCSITHNFVQYLIANKELIYKTFHHTYCPDELFIQTLCWNSRYRERVFCVDDEFKGCNRFIRWESGELKALSNEDLFAMKNSDLWFARKFSMTNLKLVENVLKLLR